MSKNVKTVGWLIAIGVMPVVVASPAAAKRPRGWDQTMACPSDAPILVGSAGAAARFSALSGCVDVRVVPEAEVRQTAETDPGDYVVHATQRDGNGRVVSGLQSAELRIEGGTGASAGDVRVSNDYTTTGVPVVRIAPLERDPADDTGRARSFSAPPIFTNLPSAPAAPITVAAVRPVAMTVAAGGIGERLLDLRPARTTRFDTDISEVARRQRVDPLLLHAVIKHESAYRPAVVSRAGAVGMMQVMPATGRALGLVPGYLTQPRVNVEAGARLLRKLADKYGSNFNLVLAAYNAGEGAVARYGNQVPPYAETQAYVRDVMGEYRRLAAENGLQLGQGN